MKPLMRRRASLDAAAAAFGDLVLGKGGEETGRGRASLSDYSANCCHGTLTAGSRNWPNSAGPTRL